MDAAPEDLTLFAAPPAGLRAFSAALNGRRVIVLAIERPRHALPATLSVAEQSIARLAVGGMSNAEIASCRHVSMRTVANQMGSIFRKLGIGSRAELGARLAMGEPR